MGIVEVKKGLRKAQRINFTWTINDYNIETRYTNKIECGKTIVKMLMDPCYVDGKVEGASPFIMFDDVEGIDKAAKEFSILVKHGVKYESSFGFIHLKLKQRYSAGPGIFLEAYNYVRFLEMRKNLIMDFEILIVNAGYEKEAAFDDSKYAKDMQNLFHNKSFCDCKFDVNGNIIKGHKFVMSTRAPMLLKSIEGANNKLTITDCSVNGFNEFLRFLYCGKLADKSDAIVFEVLSLAHTYDVQYLKQYCDEILMNNLNASNANSIYQNAHKYDLSDELKQQSFALIQVMFKNISQKLPDEFINDPKYVDNLITLAESLINGLKKKDLNNDQSFVQASPSVKQMKVEKVIDEIVKEAESLNDGTQIDVAESAGELQTDDYDQESDEMAEFSSMENYVQNMSEIIDEEFGYEEFAENIPENTTDRYLDVIIEEDNLVTNSTSEQSIADESEHNKTFDVGSNSLNKVIDNRDITECVINSEDTPTTVDIDVKFSDEGDHVEGIVKDVDITEIQKDMQNIEKFIIQVTDEVGSVVENVYGRDEVDAVIKDCSNAKNIAERDGKLNESVPAENYKIEIQIVKDFDELDINDEQLSETLEIALEDV
ncbi:uncharacterized protein [Chironomus tepperi]|uniref:uncharacterized protein n=1 Tax=Chironomus tepperi TaxID=113505 RepID=UPI00391FC210